LLTLYLRRPGAFYSGFFSAEKKWCRKPGVLPGDIVFKIEFNSVIANKLSAHLTGTDSIDGAA